MKNNILLRPIEISDHYFLKEMLYEAAWMEKYGENFDDIKITPALNQYIQDWGVSSDIGFLAYDKISQLQYGVAWARVYNKPDCLGFIKGDIPELAIAIRSDARGIGIGRQLMKKLINEVSTRFCALSLNVRAENKKAISLYESLGFTRIVGSEYRNRVNTTSFYMLATF